MVSIQKHQFLHQFLQQVRHSTRQCWYSRGCNTGGWFLWSKKCHPVPRVKVLPCKQQLCALAGASIPLFKEAKAILPSTGPETSLTANVSWTKSLLVPSGALWNQNLTQIPGTLALFHLCQELLLSSPSCVRDSHYEWHSMAAQEKGGTSSITSCERSLVRGSVAQLLLKTDRNFNQNEPEPPQRLDLLLTVNSDIAIR